MSEHSEHTVPETGEPAVSQEPEKDADARLNEILAETAAQSGQQPAEPAEQSADGEASPQQEQPGLAAGAEPSAEAEGEQTPPADPDGQKQPEEPGKTEDSEKTEDAQKTEDSEKAEGTGAKGFLGDVLDLIESVLTSVFIVMLVFTFLFTIANVEGTSMEPTLHGDDRLLVSRYTRDYHTGDILIIKNDAGYLLNSDTGGLVYKVRGIEPDGSEKDIVKRLIAKSGQVVNIDTREGAVYVDGVKLNEPYIADPTTRDDGALEYPLTVPEGYVFVLGDHRSVSKDSRNPEVGLVPEENIIGKVILRISPFSQFGWVD